MPRFDLSLLELRDYHPQVAEPADFDEFWRYTLAEARRATGCARRLGWSVGWAEPPDEPASTLCLMRP
ncbi:hypothetical protein RCH23_001152 [Cryobacterium sp. CAN_C3]|uniref:acetylxylan esterase n=1 Tax=unclassified Cryobacterium TaxID=2649013 RepID=UPI0018C95FEF|nr:acetylxylan esterase [Cryobacterium sp. CAN_C3]MEC5153783.1 hypothetical protein [Cryobacterium sp. CAN_C3]